jgi:hypothetical protein
MKMKYKQNSFDQVCKKTLKKTLLVQALSAALGATTLMVGVSAPVWAQSNTTGTVYGNVGNAANTSVVIANTQTGLTRTATPDGTGRFQATAIPPGEYKVQAMRGGAVINTKNVTVLAGVGTEVNFAQTVESVQVTARRQTIDVSNTTNGSTFTASELEKLPAIRSVENIVQLAANTTRADSRYAAGASFAGGGASENAYYINGFPVTNPLYQLGASELPFGAIAQAQVLVGGFGAEFGRSVGGVVNITTKSGTNDWEGGVSMSFAPNEFRSKRKDLYYPTTGDSANAATDGKLYLRRSGNYADNSTFGAYLGGPLVKDKLFLFVAAERVDARTGGVTSVAASAPLTAGWQEEADQTSRYLVKLDWNITNNHRIEYTGIGDKAETKLKYYGYDYATGARNGVQASSSEYVNLSGTTPTVGATANIFKYTGNITNDLTLTASYGKSKSPHTNSFEGVNLVGPPAQVSIPAGSVAAPGLTYVNPVALPVGTQALSPGSEDQVKSFRFDMEYALGKHTIRAGLDDNKLESKNAGLFLVGGGQWNYFKTGTPNSPILLTGQPTVVASGGGLGTQGYYARFQIFNDLTSAYSNQKAQYIEDRWQITKDILLTAGVRSEDYTNLNGDNIAFLTMKKQIAPRFGASWDVNGDSALKVFGTAGRYHVQIPTHIAVRGASRSTFTRQYYTYTGVDAFGAPTGRTAITGVLSSNNEFGQAKDPQTVSAQDMKPTYQDEITLGFEKSLNRSYNWGAKGTFRTLGATIDDFCDQRPFDAYAARNNIDTSNWGGFGCASFNPGRGNTFMVDYKGTGTNLTRVFLSKADLGFEDAKRTYSALDFFLEHPMRDGWYGKVNYTWSKSKGNTEGQTLSDVAQTDVAATQTWDYRELMEYAYGKLPNDRTHQIKAYGFYQFAKQWGLGGNFLAASGRPKSCLGNYLSSYTADFPDYGSSHHYCNDIIAPRGTAGNLPWDVRLDVNFVFQPDAVKGLQFKLDIFNLFNRQAAQTVDEQYNSGSAVSATYGRVISYTAPRSGRVTLQYDFK